MQIKGVQIYNILDSSDTDNVSTCYYNFSLEEGPVWVSEGESDPVEDPNVYYDTDVDRDVNYPADVVRVVDGLESDSDTSCTLVARIVGFEFQGHNPFKDGRL
jgi:hypothetical protein